MQTCDKCREVVLTCAFKPGPDFSSVKGIVSPSRRAIRRACVSEVSLYDFPDRLNTFLRRPVRLTRSAWVLSSGFI